MPGLSPEDRKTYLHIEKTVKRQCQNWLDKFNACSSYEELKKVCENYEKSAFSEKKPLRFFLFQYAYYDPTNKRRRDILMEYLSKDYYAGRDAVHGLYIIYESEEVIKKYDFSQGSAATNFKRKKEVRSFATDLKNNAVKTEINGYFDTETHFYYEEINIYQYVTHRGIRQLKLCPVKVNVNFLIF